MDREAHICRVLFQTGAFVSAWSWVLVYYSVSHVLVGESPLEDQIGLGLQQQHRHLAVLVLPYFLVCGAVAALLTKLREMPSPTTEAIGAAVEFSPAPVLNATLLSFLGQITGATGLKLCSINLMISYALAVAVHVVPTKGRLGALSDVFCKTVGFGLGVAWNYAINRGEPSYSSFVSLTVYVVVVALLAARLAAPEVREDTVTGRHSAMMSFAARVVFAFAVECDATTFILVEVVAAILVSGTLIMLISRFTHRCVARGPTRIELDFLEGFLEVPGF